MFVQIYSIVLSLCVSLIYQNHMELVHDSILNMYMIAIFDRQVLLKIILSRQIIDIVTLIMSHVCEKKHNNYDTECFDSN